MSKGRKRHTHSLETKEDPRITELLEIIQKQQKQIERLEQIIQQQQEEIKYLKRIGKRQAAPFARPLPQVSLLHSKCAATITMALAYGKFGNLFAKIVLTRRQTHTPTLTTVAPNSNVFSSGGFIGKTISG